MTGSMFLPCYAGPVTKLIGNAAILVGGLFLSIGGLLAAGVLVSGATLVVLLRRLQRAVG